MSTTTRRRWRAGAATAAAAALLGGCSFSPYEVPLPGGADLGDHPYKVTVKFRDVLDLVPQSGVRVDEVPVGKVSKVDLDGWNATVTLEINGDVKLPDDAVATIRQTSLLGEKFVSLAPPEGGGTGTLAEGDTIGLERTGRNPEIEEVLSAASLIFNGGGLEKTQTIVREVNKALDGNEPEVRELLATANDFIGQLDDNKQSLITALEKVDRLAVETRKQEGAITGALDDLPDALRVVDGQRDELVTLLKKLDRLSDVGTRVIKASKDDVIADLEALRPTLKNLGTAAEDLVDSLQVLLTFPFTDSIVGDTLQEARDHRQGDYTNLSVRLDLKAETLTQFLDLDGLIGGLAEGAATGDAEKAADPLANLLDLVEGFVPELPSDSPLPTGLPTKLPSSLPTDGGLGGLGGGTKTPKPSSTPTTRSGGGFLDMPGLCGLFGRCRPAAASSSPQAAATNLPDGDLADVLLTPAVQR